jgi:phage/plasmid-associated DNA primase
LHDLLLAVSEWRTAGRRLGMPKAVADNSQHYLDEQDPLLAWMQVCCIAGPGWADAQAEEHPFKLWWMSFRLQSGRSRQQANSTWFGRQLTKFKFVKRETNKGPAYTGPQLTDEARRLAEDALYAEEDEIRRQEAAQARYTGS